ncbi:hypothetical protein V8F20_001332 [Naviculisporaceae sp. PSN 640]
MASKVIRVLAAGKHEGMGRRVIEGLRPEVEVVHFMLSTSIESELPYLLQNKLPPNPASNIASDILGRPISLSETPPQALILGGAYNDDAVASLRALVQDSSKYRQIPWVRVDASKSKFSPAEEPEKYSQDVISRFKEGLVKLEKEGKLDVAEEKWEVYFI